MGIKCNSSFYLIFSVYSAAVLSSAYGSEVFPEILRGDWFTWEDGSGLPVRINQSEHSLKGQPLEYHVVQRDIRDYVFYREPNCYYCSRFHIRSWNIVERHDGPCMSTGMIHREFTEPYPTDFKNFKLEILDEETLPLNQLIQLSNKTRNSLKYEVRQERLSAHRPSLDKLCLHLDFKYYSNRTRNSTRADNQSEASEDVEKDGINERDGGGYFVKHGVLHYRTDPVPVHCLSFIIGHYKMAWRNLDSLSGVCAHPQAELESCQKAGDLLTAGGQYLTVKYKKCAAVRQSYDAVVPYSCLGSWHVGTLQFLAVANLQQGNEEEKYRCFVQDLNEPTRVLGVSDHPSCRGLQSPDTSPVLMTLQPVVPSQPPSCTFPSEYLGTWVNTGLGEHSVTINSTHLVTSTWRGPREMKVVHVCQARRKRRYLLAAMPDNGCDIEYVCWEMLPRHDNVIRYRKGRHSDVPTLETCDHRVFGSSRHWIYDTLLADPPSPVPCPIHGRFSLSQTGSNPLVPRVLGGVTASPLDSYVCREKGPVWTVCGGNGPTGRGTDRIVLDLDACLDIDQWGRPAVHKEVVDYELQCVGHWRENLRSYLVTYSPGDPVSRYKCWVYARLSPTLVHISLAVGSACGARQTHLSGHYNESAHAALTLRFNERLHDECPLIFSDGALLKPHNSLRRSSPVVFSFTSGGGGTCQFPLLITLIPSFLFSILPILSKAL